MVAHSFFPFLSAFGSPVGVDNDVVHVEFHGFCIGE